MFEVLVGVDFQGGARLKGRNNHFADMLRRRRGKGVGGGFRIPRVLACTRYTNLSGGGTGGRGGGRGGTGGSGGDTSEGSGGDTYRARERIAKGGGVGILLIMQITQ